jgi:radical SAM protein with 4Fe4S-binding SPASM domain
MASSPSVVRSVGAEEFVSALLSKSSPESLPLTCMLDITERCNLECVHCYLGGRRHCGMGDISIQLASRIFDALSAGGVLVMVMTGGEPLVHPGFRDIWSEARQRGFLVTLFTNGTLIDDDTADFLANHPPRRVELSAYGCTQTTYESITGVPGSYARFAGGVERLREAGVRTRLKFPILRENRHELDRARAWAESMGMGFRSNAIVSATLDGDCGPLAHRVAHENDAELLSDALRECAFECEADGNNPPGNSLLFTCGAGVKTVHIDVSGNMHPCTLWRDDGRPLLETTPEEWQGHVSALRQERLPDSSPCSQCRARPCCPSCPALSKLETGQAGAAMAHFCEIVNAAATVVTKHLDASEPDDTISIRRKARRRYAEGESAAHEKKTVPET